MVNMPKSLSDHPSLVGIVRLPRCIYETNEVDIPLIIKIGEGFQNLTQKVDMATIITSEEKLSTGYSIPKVTITDFAPYTFYVLTDGEGDPIVMQPQYLPSTLYIRGQFALSHQPIEKYYPIGYKGDNKGLVYNITNLNQMMLPTATNEGMAMLNANANTIMQNRKSQITGNVLNGVNVVGSAIATKGISLVGGGVSSVINGIMEVKNSDARTKDSIITPSTISSFGTPSTRNAFGTDNVRLIKYTVRQEVKEKLNNFVSRYGNKYNNYGEIDLKRYKGYIKYISPNIDSKIDNVYINKIKEILERGVFIE